MEGLLRSWLSVGDQHCQFVNTESEDQGELLGSLTPPTILASWLFPLVGFLLGRWKGKGRGHSGMY